MTQDEIIEMAREVQKDCVVSEDGYRIWSYESLGRLIKLAAAKEREAYEHDMEVLMNALWKACGDDEEVVNATIESQGTLTRARGQA
jgi:hypothetical protein